MATRGSCVKWNDGCLALGACSRFMGARKSSHYLLLRRGVVPHDTTIDADIDCSGFAALRLREQPVQSTRVASAQCYGGRRCGGSLWRRSRRSERLRLTCLSPSDSLRGELARASESEASRERSMLLRSPLRRLPLAWITTKRALTPDLPQPPRIHSEGSCPERAKAKRVASAQCCCGRRCGGSLWRRSRRSERLRLTCLSPLGFTPRGAGQSERKRSESRALKSESRALITAFRRCGRRRHRGQARCRNAH